MPQGKLGEILDGEMRKRKWNQAEFAARSHVTQGTINKYINGTNVGEPKGSTLDKLADALGIPSQTLHDAAKADRLSKGEQAELNSIPRERVQEYLSALDRTLDELDAKDQETLFNKLLRVFNPWSH